MSRCKAVLRYVGAFVPFVSVFSLTGCAVFGIQDVDGDGAGAGGAACVTSLDCGVGASDVCLDGMCVEARTGQYPSLEPPQAVPTSAVHPALAAVGVSTVDTHRLTGNFGINEYTELVSEVAVLPVLRAEAERLYFVEKAFSPFQAPMQPSAVLDVAAHYFAIHENQRAIDERLGSLEDAEVSFDTISRCLDEFEGRAAMLKGGIPLAAQDSTILLACVDDYDRILTALGTLNAQTLQSAGHFLVDPEILKNILDHLPGVRDAITGDSVTRVSASMHDRIRSLPFAVAAVFRLVTEHLVRAQNLYPLVRQPVEVPSEYAPERPDPIDGTARRVFSGTVGHFASMLVRQAWAEAGIPHESAANEVFRTAMYIAAKESRSRNLGLQQSLQIGLGTDKAWILALAAEELGLMALYGGYDQSGAPRLFQSLHAELLEEAHRKQGSLGALTMASGVACIGLGVAAGILGTPILGAAAFGACAIATGIGVLELLLLGELSHATQTLAYMGTEYALFPPAEADDIAAATGWTSLWVLADVLFLSFDVTDIQRVVRARAPIPEAKADTQNAIELLGQRSTRAGVGSASVSGPSLRKSAPLDETQWTKEEIRWLLDDLAAPLLRVLDDADDALQAGVERVLGHARRFDGQDFVVHVDGERFVLRNATPEGITRLHLLELVASTPEGRRLLALVDQLGFPPIGFSDDIGEAEGRFRHADEFAGIVQIRAWPLGNQPQEPLVELVDTLAHELLHFVDDALVVDPQRYLVPPRIPITEEDFVLRGAAVVVFDHGQIQLVQRLAELHRIDTVDLTLSFGKLIEEVRAQRFGLLVHRAIGPRYQTRYGRDMLRANSFRELILRFYAEVGEYYAEQIPLLEVIATIARDSWDALYEEILPRQLWDSALNPEFYPLHSLERVWDGGQNMYDVYQRMAPW